MDVLTAIKRRPVTPELEEIMKATMADVQEGSCVGPFGSTEEVTKFLGSSSWIPTQRFAVNQANRVRGCDSATVNFVNVAAEIQEKLQLPSTDQNVAVIRRLWAEAEGCPIEGWVLDERKAYRQIPIKPDQEVQCDLLQEPAESCYELFRDDRSLVRSGGCGVQLQQAVCLDW